MLWYDLGKYSETPLFWTPWNHDISYLNNYDISYLNKIHSLLKDMVCLSMTWYQLKEVEIAEQLTVRTGAGDSIKQFGLQPPTDNFSTIALWKKYVWKYTELLHAIILPCFPTFSVLLYSPTSHYILLFLLLVYTTFFYHPGAAWNVHIICHRTMSYTCIYWLPCDRFVWKVKITKWHPKWSHSSVHP